MNIGGLNELLADFKLYKEQKQQEGFAKTFGYKVMKIYITQELQSNFQGKIPVLDIVARTTSVVFDLM